MVQAVEGIQVEQGTIDQTPTSQEEENHAKLTLQKCRVVVII